MLRYLSACTCLPAAWSAARMPSALATCANAGCTTAPSETVTPGWCTGGRSMSGKVTGMYGLLTAVASDPNGNYLYVSDYSNNNVQRLTSP